MVQFRIKTVRWTIEGPRKNPRHKQDPARFLPGLVIERRHQRLGESSSERKRYREMV